MATAKRRQQRRSLSKATTALVVLVALAAGWWFYGEGLVGNAEAGTGYGAKVACSCRHISGRELDSCESDFLPGMEMVFLSEDEEAQSVTASVPLLASQTARYREGFGCLLEG